MAQQNGNSWTGTYSSHTAKFCGYILYNWYPAYSPTQSRLDITQCGINKISGSDAEWSAGTARAKAICSGQTTYEGTKSLSSSSSLAWGENGNKALKSTTASWYFSKTTSAQTKSISIYGGKEGGSAWNGNATGVWSLTIPALDSYAVTYNANGGVGTIADDTKWHSEALTLSDGTGFTREHHTFKGWNTAADGTGTHYDAGDTYTDNAALALYAEWELNAVVVDTKVSGEWKSGIIYTKVNGSWVIPFIGYTKVNGSWEEITKE